MPIGYLFEVVTNGYGSMSGYGSQVPPHDRWAIASWIRVLQASQNVPATALSADDRQRVESGATIEFPTGPASPGSAEGPEAEGSHEGGEHAQ